MHIIPPLALSGKSTLNKLEPSLQYPMISNALQTTGPFGKIITRKLQGDGFTLWHQHLIIEKATHLYAVTDTPAFFIHYMIQGSPVIHIAGKDPFVLNEKKYLLYYLPETKQEIQLDIGQYQSLQIELSAAYMSHFSIYHPPFKRLLNSTIRHHAQPKYFRPCKTDTALQVLINKLLHPGNAPSALQCGSLVNQLLHTYFKERSRTPGAHLSQTDNQGLMEEVRQVIDKNLSKKLDTEQLAESFGFTQTALQRRFCQYFKQTIFAYYTRKRLDMAMEFIQEGKLNLGEICFKIGYSHTNDFSRAFKKQFGHPPIYYKKKQQLLYLLKYINE